MKHGDMNWKKPSAFWYLALLIGLALLAGTAAADSSLPTYTKLEKISDDGFGDPQNNYAWSVAEFNGDLYVGTGRNIPYFVAQAMKARGVFPENWTLSFLTTPGGSPPPPLVLPNHTSPTQEEVIAWSEDMRAEIWRYHEGAWTQVHQASTFFNPLNGYTYPEGIGYRAMTTFTNTEGQDALYAGVGFGFGPILVVTSTDGTTWVPVNTASIPSRDTRAMISHNGKLYVGTGDGIYASSSPSPYEDTWEKVADFEIASLASHNGYLYAGTGNPIGPSQTNGFEVWRSTVESPTGPSDWTCVVSGGAGDAWNVLAATIREYDGDLYVGSMNLPFGTGTDGVKGFDLIRVDDSDSWDLIVGNYQPKIPTDPRGPPLSGWPSGYTNPFNLYAWSIEEYNGNLYLGSFDIFSLARFIDDIPGASEILVEAVDTLESADQTNMPEEIQAFSDRIEEYARMNPEFADDDRMIQVIRLLADNLGGGDLWTSPDGVHWYPVDLNGLGDPDNYGLRTMMNTGDGLLIGTANPFSGCEVWIGTAPECPPKSVSNLHNTTYLPDRITWNWTDPSSDNFSHVTVYLDGEFMENVPKGVQTFTATGLDPGCEYTIETRTVSTGGLVNKKWVTHTARTAPGSLAWKFHSDLRNSGIYDDGGTRPEGALLWSYPTGDDVDSSPAVVDGVVYVGGHAFDARTGERLWWFREDYIDESSPAVVDGVAYFGSYSGKLFAVDAGTGTAIWNFTTGAGVHSSPAVANGIVYFGSKDHNVYALDSVTGDLVWNFTTGSPVFSSPAVVDGVVYIGSCDKNVYALDAETGDLVWNFTTGGMVYSSPAVVDGQVYVGSFDGYLYVLHADTGEYFWTHDAGDPVYSSPAVADGIVYFGGRDGFLYALDTEIPKYRWSYHAGEWIDSSPAVANGVVYFTATGNPGESGLFALDAESGEFLWKYTTDMGLKSSPAVADGVVYFGSRDRGSVIAIGPDIGSPNLMIGKLAPAFHENATEMSYTLFYKNQGTGTAEDVVLTDYLPPSVEFVSGTDYPVYDETTRTVTWEFLGDLPHGATGSESVTVRIPSSVPYDTVLTNTANITTSTPETRYDDNTVSVNTTVKRLWFPPDVSISPSVPGPWGDPTLDWRDTVTFTFNQTTCPPDTPVNIRIHINDGEPDIYAPMTGGPQIWSYTTSFYPRHGHAEVTIETPGCIITSITFPVSIEAAGYVYDAVSGVRISGADVWLQWPDGEGNWVNIPTGLSSPPMQPDENPLTTGADGQFQWEVTEGSYRVYAEADGYAPATTAMVNSPPELSGLCIGLLPTTGNLWVGSDPTGAEIYLDGTDTGFVTSHELTGVSPGQHEVVLRLAGYHDYNRTVTVTAGATTYISGSFDPLPPVAGFSANTTSGETPLPVRFTDNSTGIGITGWLWTFGDGATSNETEPEHIYNTPGTFTVSLRVTGEGGNDTATRTDYIQVTQSVPVPDFEGTPLSGDAPLEVVFSDTSTGTVTSRWWDFGDGTAGWENGTSTVSHMYQVPGTFDVSLTAGNSAGQATVTRAEYIRTDPSGLPPDARFTTSSRLGTVPMTVTFTDRSTRTPVMWLWDFGDGTSSSEQNPEHTYNVAGRFRVTLTASNSGGSDSYASYVWVIQGRIVPTPTVTPTIIPTPIIDRPPMAFFSMDSSFGVAPLVVQFTDQSLRNPTSWNWDFGDGEISTLQNPVHTFDTKGRYTIRLTVQNPTGQSTTAKRLYVY